MSDGLYIEAEEQDDPGRVVSLPITAAAPSERMTDAAWSAVEPNVGRRVARRIARLIIGLVMHYGRRFDFTHYTDSTIYVWWPFRMEDNSSGAVDVHELHFSLRSQMSELERLDHEVNWDA